MKTLNDYTEQDVLIRTGHAHMGLVTWAPDETAASFIKGNSKAKSAASIILMQAGNAISHILQTPAPGDEVVKLLEQFQANMEEMAEKIRMECHRIDRR